MHYLQWYLHRVTLVEANEVLGSFDVRLREYAARKLHKQGVHLVQVLIAKHVSLIAFADAVGMVCSLCFRSLETPASWTPLGCA